MKAKSTFVILLAIFTLLIQSRTARSQDRTSSLKEINSYTASIDRFINSNKKPRIFGDISSATETKSHWKEFKTENERQQAETGDNLNQSANVWTKTGKIIGANFTFTSPSGDWVHFVMYYFREDGSLAKIQARLNTFYGDVSIIRDRYYDSQGRLIKSTRKFLDLQTQKPKKPTEYMEKPIPVYRRVSDVPFGKLL